MRAIVAADLPSLSTTVNTETCTIGSTCTIPFDTNSVANTSQAGINLETSTTNAVGLTVTPTNSATNVEKFEVTGGTYTGTAANITATSNSSLTTLSSLSLPSSQVTGLGTFATQNYATPPAIGGTTPAAGYFSALTLSAITGSTQCLQVNSSGAVSGTGSGCGGSSSSITVGTTTISGGTPPCLIDNSTGTTMGCAALGNALSLSSGTLNTTAPERTVMSSPTVAAGDMGGQIISNVSGGGTLTIPAISSTVFASGMTLSVVNYSASTEAVSTTPTVNAGGGCVTATGIPAGDTWQLLSNGTTLDCFQTVSTASSGVSSFTGDGTLISNSASTGAVTATLASAGADTLWGNTSGSSGAAGYHTVNSTALAVLLDTTAITVSGCTPSASSLAPTTGGTITQPSTPCTTVTFTFAVTAPHGWNCSMGDVTQTNAGTYIPEWVEASNSTTTCVMKIPAAAQVASDVLQLQSSWY